MRLPYVPDPPPASTPEAAEVIARVQARRAPGQLLPLDLALLHSTVVADGWNSFIGAIRTKTSLSVDITELAISRVAVLNGANFEWNHHAPLLAAAEGFEPRALEIVQEKEIAKLEQTKVKELLSEKQLAVIAYTDAMTVQIEVPEEVFDALRTHFNETEIVELTATIAAYNCVSRFLVALDVGEKNGTKRELF